MREALSFKKCQSWPKKTDLVKTNDTLDQKLTKMMKKIACRAIIFQYKIKQNERNKSKYTRNHNAFH